MKSLYRFARIAGLLPTVALLATGCATPEGRAAAIAAGTLVGVGVGAQVLTYSDLHVDVDVYRETLPKTRRSLGEWIRDIGGPIDRSQRSSPDRERTPPFRLDLPAAARRAALAARPLTAQEMAIAVEGIENDIDRLRAREGPLAEGVTHLRVAAAGSQPEWKATLAEFEDRLDTVREAIAAFDGLKQGLATNQALGGLSADRVVALDTLWAGLVGALERLADDSLSAGPAYLSFVFARVWQALRSDAAIAKAVDVETRPQMEAIVAKPEPDLRDSLSRMLAAAAPKITAKNRESVDKALRELGLAPVSVADLEASGGAAEQVRRVLGAQSALFGVANLADDALLKLQDGINGFNVGPLVNEGMQQVLAENEMIDVITDPGNRRNWRRFDSAKSTGRTGNHNAIVYLENLATPILKSSEFDPSAFIRANGLLYQATFKAVVDAFGLPAAGGAAASPYNTFGARGRLEASRQALGNQRKTALGALSGIVGAQNAVKGAQAAADKPDAWAADKKGPAIQGAIDALNAQATKLEALASGS